jgi:hypothetical protein
MKNIILKLTIIIFIGLIIFACSKDDDSPNTNNSTSEVENSTRTIANLQTNFFKPKTGAVKGIVILGSGNNPEDPTPGDINDSYLKEICKSLGSKGFVCAIVKYRDQPFVGNNFENFNSNTAMLVADFNDVGNALRTEFSLDRNKLIFGGTSYSANCLVSQNAWGNSMTDIKGIIAIMGSCAMDTAQNQKNPILAFACNNEPFGTNYGLSIVQNISNSSIKAMSFGLTDSSCNGHSNSNNWISTITEKVMIWIP